MASNDSFETKLNNFENELKDEKSFEKKLNSLFEENYNEIIEDILILKEDIFLNQIKEGVKLLLEDYYTDKCFTDERLKKLINKYEEEIYLKYNHDYSLINKVWTSSDKVTKRRTNNENYLTGFRKHCIHTDDHALHNCCSVKEGRRSNKNCHFICVYSSDIKKEIKFVICELCKKVYYSTFILSYCNNCNVEYFTSLLTSEENPDMLLATWKNYHCPQLINEKMKCMQCHNYIYINMKNGYLNCLNKNCEFVSKPSRILWTCSFCKTDFKSEAIPYNPLDILNIKKLIKQIILLKHKAHPKKIPCCKLNVFFTEFFHKKECNGLLYEMELNGKLIVVCEKCHAINYYERFKWTCPKCGKRFRDKDDNPNTTNNTRKNSYLGDNKNNNTSNFNLESKNESKELIFDEDNNSIKNDKKTIENQRVRKEIYYSPNISKLRRRKRFKSQAEDDVIYLRDMNKTTIDNKENDNNKLEPNNEKKDDQTNKNEKNNYYNKKFRKFGAKNNNSDQKNLFENKNDVTEENIDNNLQKKINSPIIERKSRIKGLYSRLNNNKKDDDKDKKENEKETKEFTIENENKRYLSPRLMWKKRRETDNSKNQNILSLYACNIDENEDKEIKVKENNEKEEENKKSKNKEKEDQNKKGSGIGLYKRRYKRLLKLEKEEEEKEEKKDEKKEDKKEEIKEEKKEDKKEEKGESSPRSPRSPISPRRRRFSRIEKEINLEEQNNKPNNNEDNEEGKETKAKIILKEEENDEKKEEKEEKKEKIAMSIIPGVSEHLYNHINKRISKILERCKIPVFNVEDYMFDRKLGEGGYAIIFAVYKMDDETCKEFAMKKIIAGTLNEIDKFTKEFELVYSCNHPNIMKIYGICIRMLDQTTYSLYVLMEISTGDWDTDIKKRLLKNKSYTEKELIDILRQLTGALLFMQQKLKISHRDIKPQNILMFGENTYKIADFGEAKESKIRKDINTLRGTELYMSPALYAGLKNERNDVNHDPYKSDVFSLGFCFIYAAALNFKLLYQLRDVYNNKQMNQILKQQLKKKYSDTFIDILSHMMEIDEAERFDFSQLMDTIDSNYDKEGNLKNDENNKENKGEINKKGFIKKSK